MSATVGAALKKVAVYLIQDKKALKFVGGTILVILIVILMPIIALLGLFSGTINIDTDRLHEMVAQQQAAAMSSWSNVESAMTAAGYDQQRIQEARVLVTFALYDHAAENGFAERLVGCFAQGQTDAQLVSAVNSTFGTSIVAQDFTNAMASLRAAYIDCSGYTDPTTKNNLDLVQWATYAHSKGWGYVWGTYGQMLDKNLFEYKKTQYPEEVGGKAEFIEANWLGGRTADCVGFIKGYSWFEPTSGNIIYATNGMPDISADEMYNNATEKGTIDTIPEIPGLAVWHQGHIGIYIGGGEVIHASGTTRGVIKTPIGDSGWTHWLKIPYITYAEEVAEPTEPTTTPHNERSKLSMQINAALRLKQAAIIEQPCIIADIMELPESEYASLYQNLLKDRGYFSGMKDMDCFADGQRCCVLILGEGQEDGILVDTQGNSYATMSAFIPNARTLVKVHTRELADYLISEGTEHTQDGRWSATYEELYHHFGAYVTDTNGNGKLLKAELERRAEINELIMTEDCIEMAYHLEYCDHCQQVGIDGAMDLLSVVGCNITDEHDSMDDDVMDEGPVQSM